MSYNLDMPQSTPGARIKVVGVGGAGGNAVNTMIQSQLEGVEFIVANTDRQALDSNLAPTKLQIGTALTRGLGAGADPKVGEKAALESQAEITSSVTDADMVFVTTGLGGGTGTGAAPIVAKQAREAGALTVAVVSKPFSFEGRRRMKRALEGMEAMRDAVDTIIVVPNERLMAVAGEEMTFIEAFREADRILYNAVKGVSDLITVGGLINVDFADVKAIMQNAGLALMGTGEATGENRAQMAAELAVSSPLLEDAQINGATGILINIAAGPNLRMIEVQEAAGYVEDAADEDANIIVGAVIDEDLGDTLRVTVIATGFPDLNRERLAIGNAGASVITDNFASSRDMRHAGPYGQRREESANAYAAPPHAARSEMAPPQSLPQDARVASSAMHLGAASVRAGGDYEN